MFAIVAVLGLAIVAVGGIAVYAESRMAANTELLDQKATQAWLVSDMENSLTQTLVDWNLLDGVTSPEQGRVIAPRVLADVKNVAGTLRRLDEYVAPDESEQYQPLKKRTAEFMKVRGETAQIAIDDGIGSMRAQTDVPTLMANGTDLRKALDTYSDQVVAQLDPIRAGTTTFSNSMKLLVAITALVGLAIGVAVALWIGTTMMSRPLARIARALRDLERGNLDTEIVPHETQDEIGEICAATSSLRDELRAARAAREAEAAAARRRDERRATTDAASKAFEGDIESMVQRLSAAAAQLQQSATGMNATAGVTHQRSNAAAEQTTSNVQTVASAAEELAASVRKIAQQVAITAKVSSEAKGQVTATAKVVQGLAVSAQKIGEVVSLINDIASQTNLLALNATIEAARAGEAGKGFAVVANEVKTLAEQTSKATDEISGQIAAVQSETTDVVRAIEEQGAATGEIAQNVQQAPLGTQEVTSNIVNVTEAANDTGRVSSEVQVAARDLSGQADSLRERVNAFLTSVRSDAA